MSTPTIPLPCTYGDARVPMAVWQQTEQCGLCWLWSGKTSPTGSPIYRRKSVWRLIYNALCGGQAKDLPANCRPTCGLQSCVNPDHRVPPENRIPVITCPTCGQPTYGRYSEDTSVAPRPERPPVVHPEVQRLEEGTRFSMADVMERTEPELGPPEEVFRHPDTVDYGPGDHYRLTGRVYRRPVGQESQFEVRDEEDRTRWLTEEQMTKPQRSDLWNRSEMRDRGNDSVFVYVTREERYPRGGRRRR
jgi:hypothetical protein